MGVVIVFAAAVGWVAVFVGLPMLFKRSIRADLKPYRPVAVQILFSEVLEGYVRIDCVQLAATTEPRRAIR